MIKPNNTKITLENQEKNLALLQQFEPLARLTLGRLNELASICIVEAISKNLDPLRMNTQNAQSVYLVKGELGVRYKDGTKVILCAGTNETQYPINSGQRQIKYTRALTPIEVVRIDEDLLDIMMTWDQLSGNEPENPQLTTPLESVGTNTIRSTANWMADTSIFSAAQLQNGVFSHLPPANIEQMFKRMVPTRVKADQTIIKQGAEGDYYYLIESGTAIVTREKDGEQLMLAELHAGNAFGEEALVSDTKRNATGTMKTAGELLRLNKTDFIELLKASIVNTISMVEAQKKVSNGAIWLDVRFPSEFEFNHLKSAINAPLNELRKIVPTLNQFKTQDYIAYCQTGRRSAAAAFILAQYGVKAEVLEGGLRGGMSK